jgi:hypothetical protein
VRRPFILGTQARQSRTLLQRAVAEARQMDEQSIENSGKTC